MSIPKIDPYPPAPTPEDDESTFDEKAYEHAASLEPRRIQMNEVAVYANTRASDANNRAVAAASSATASANSAVRADEWANKAPGSEVDSGKFSGRHYADMSDKFANAPEDVEVEPGKYSAQHYMEKAKKIANVHATTVETDPLPTVMATNVQEALRDLAYQADQLKLAKNQLKYGEGPYPALDFQFAGAKYLDPRIQFTRASLDWDENGREYGVNEPVLLDKGLWASGARTNLFLWSTDLTSGAWNKPRMGVTKPNEWFLLTPTSDRGSHQIQQAVSVSSDGDYVFSFEAKKGEYKYLRVRVGLNGPFFGDALIDIEEGTVEAGGLVSKVIKTEEGWKVSVSLEGFSATDVATIGFWIYDNDSQSEYEGEGGGIYVKNLQVEKGGHATPYIPTKGSQVTVAATSASFGWVASIKTLYIESEIPPASSQNRTIFIARNLNNYNDQIRVFLRVDGRIQLRLRQGAVDLFAGPIYQPVGNVIKLALSFDPDGVKYSVNGLNASLPDLEFQPDLGLFDLGSIGGNEQLLGSIKQASFYYERLTSQQLLELTA